MVGAATPRVFDLHQVEPHPWPIGWDLSERGVFPHAVDMSNSTRTSLSRLRQSLLALAIATIAGGCTHDKHADAQASNAAQQVQDVANFMFGNCKLAPQPDAALHGLLGT